MKTTRHAATPARHGRRGRRRPGVWAAGALGAVVLVLGACTTGSGSPDVPADDGTGPAGDPLIRFYDQALEWGPCDDYATNGVEEQVLALATTAECSRLEVPSDYDEPEGDVASVAVLRVPARGEAKGSLLFNPGGPGGSGVLNGAVAGTSLSGSRLTEHFDLVGFDPRGVGATQPAVDCWDPEGDSRLDHLFEGSSGVAPVLSQDEVQGLADRCAEGSGGVEALPDLGSRTTARDMDVLRAVLGDEKLTYLGQSYGTRLGTVYAEQFPDKVRAMVLDGAFDPTLGTLERRVGAYAGFQDAFNSMAAACAQEPDCPLGTDPAQATEVFQSLVRPLREDPVPALDAQLTFDGALEGVFAGLYAPASWPRIVEGIAQVRDGRGDELLQLSYDFGARDADGRWPNTSEAGFAINCMDEQRLTPEANRELRETAFERAPFMDPGVEAAGEARDACSAWPQEPDLGIPYGQDVEGLPETLVVSYTADPTTPYESAVSLADTLGSSLLTVEGDGHTVVSGGKNTCVDDIAAAYLVDLELPDAEATCPS